MMASKPQTRKRAPKKASEASPDAAPYYRLFWPHSNRGSEWRLLSAGLECFIAKGFHGTTTREIAQKAGMSPAALYLHFKSKEVLLYTISDAVVTALLDELRVRAVGDASVVEQLRTLVKCHVSFHAEMARALNLVSREMLALTPKHQKAILNASDAVTAIIRDCIDKGAKAGVFSISHLSIVTTTVVSLGVSVMHWFSPGGPLSPAELAELYAVFVLRMLGVNSRPDRADYVDARLFPNVSGTKRLLR